ncbi:asparaginase domain-containing protein, partial [Halorubrum sp. AJ67]
MTGTDRCDRREDRTDRDRSAARTDGGRPRVAVVACGGTIASEPGDNGAAPEKTGADLVEAVPAVTDHARVT